MGCATSIATLQKPGCEVLCLAVASENLIVGGRGHKLQAFDTENEECVARAQAAGDVDFICMDGIRFYTGGPSSLQIWDTALVPADDYDGHLTFNCVATLTPASDVYCIAADQNCIYSGGSNSSLQVWDKTSFDNLSTLKAMGDVKYIALDQERLFTGGTSSSLQVWSKARLECVKTLKPIADVHCIAIDEKRLYTGGSNSSFQVWDKTSLDCISTVPVDGNVNFIALDGFRLLTGGTNRLLQIWEKASVPTLTNSTKANSDVFWIEVDDSRIYVASFERNEVELWEKSDLYYSSQ